MATNTGATPGIGNALGYFTEVQADRKQEETQAENDGDDFEMFERAFDPHNP
jgi:hypothetical protein